MPRAYTLWRSSNSLIRPTLLPALYPCAPRLWIYAPECRGESGEGTGSPRSLLLKWRQSSQALGAKKGRDTNREPDKVPSPSASQGSFVSGIPRASPSAGATGNPRSAGSSGKSGAAGAPVFSAAEVRAQEKKVQGLQRASLWSHSLDSMLPVSAPPLVHRLVHPRCTLGTALTPRVHPCPTPDGPGTSLVYP